MSLKPSFWPPGLSSRSLLDGIDARQQNTDESDPSDHMPGLSMPEWTTTSQAQGPFNAEGREDEDERAAQDKQTASREWVHEGKRGARRSESEQACLSCERDEPIHVRPARDLTASAIRIFLHALPASAMAAKAISKPAGAMRALPFGNQPAHGGIVQHRMASRRALHRRMTVSAGCRAGRSEYKVAVRIDEAAQVILRGGKG